MICGVREAFECSLLEILHTGLDTWDSKKMVNMSSLSGYLRLLASALDSSRAGHEKGGRGRQKLLRAGR